MAKNQIKKIRYEKRGVVWTTYPEICKSCGLCIAKCPVKCLSFDIEENDFLGLPTVKNDIGRCIACGTCETVCPDCAIRLIKRK